MRLAMPPLADGWAGRRGCGGRRLEAGEPGGSPMNVRGAVDSNSLARARDPGPHGQDQPSVDGIQADRAGVPFTSYDLSAKACRAPANRVNFNPGAVAVRR
jgi:hypothetical protein